MLRVSSILFLMSFFFFSCGKKGEIVLVDEKVKDLKVSFSSDDLDKNHLAFIGKEEIKIVYLGYFENLQPQENYYLAAKLIDFKPNDRRTEQTYSKYNSIDDKIDPFHYYTAYIKFGYGRCTEEASMETRERYIDRDEAVKLVHKYDNEFPEDDFEEVLTFLNLDQNTFEEIVNKEALDKHKNNLVVHESDLPKGKGMSPMTWQILEGNNEISITLFEMQEKLDSGNVYLQDVMEFNGLELVSEIRDKQAEYTFNLCKKFLDNYPKILESWKAQEGVESFYKVRKPEDSQLDFNKTIAEQFNLLRVVDNDKYPAFFEHQGEKYFLKITK